MNRRKFFKISAPLAMTPLIINGTSIKAIANDKLISTLSCYDVHERVVVLIQLKGGNDGVNTIIPVDQYTDYAALRPNIKIPDTGTGSYIDLDTTLAIQDQIGLHPALTGFKSLYDQGLMNIIQGASYTNQNRSHFKSTDIYNTGGDGTSTNNNKTTGWMGRYLSEVYPGAAGNPSPAMPDPLGIQLGDNKPSLGFHTEEEHAAAINLTGQDPSGFFNLVTEIGGPHLTNVPLSEYGEEIQYIMNTEDSVSRYAARISDVFDNGTNSVAYPSSNLANQLKTVAALLSGGSRTKIFLTVRSGWDTHNDQVDSSNPTIGAHANLLGEVGNAVKAFMDDLKGLGLDDKVMVATFSEFGRTADENGSYGTDHGTLAPMFIFGKGVEPGISGTNVSLDPNDIDNGGLLTNQQYDYRQVFTTLLQDWLGASDNVVTTAEFDPFLTQKIGFVNANFKVREVCYMDTVLPAYLLVDSTVLTGPTVEINWQLIGNGTGSKMFMVEKSADGVNFFPFKKVIVSNNSKRDMKYTEVDENPHLGTSYYRVTQVYQDNFKAQPHVITVFIDEDEITTGMEAKSFPNPAKDRFNVSIQSDNDTMGVIEVYDSRGSRVKAIDVDIFAGRNNVPINTNGFSSGQYMIRVSSEQGFTRQLKQIIQK